MKPSKPYVVGLTGGIACGKSHVSRELRALGVPVMDADAISHGLTGPEGAALPAIRQAFGDGVFDGETLNRKALGALVFSDDEKRGQLEGILHPLILRTMLEETAASQAPIVAWDVPLLYETGLDRQCDEVWCVYITLDEQLKRVMRRDHLSQQAAQARIDSQMPMEEKKARARHRISTMGTRAETRRHVRGLLRDLQRRLKK
ncbi:MAG: dephospho-CoA kinase [Clostridia bacterium]|nr:dephospho-CoA kinase [Clostridia bacterium]